MSGAMKAEPSTKDQEIGIKPESQAARQGSLWGTVGFSFLFVAIFGLIVFVIGRLHGLDLLVPSENISIALGYSAALPILFGLICYLVAQIFWAMHKKVDIARLGRNAACDLTMLLLFVVAKYFHFSLKLWTPFVNESLFDLLYYEIDVLLEPLVAFSAYVSTTIRGVLGEGTRWYQFVFQSLFFVAFAQLSIKRGRVYHQFLLAIILMNVLGALSYLAFPAIGPFFYEIGASSVTDDAQVSMLRTRYLMFSFGPAWVNEYGGLFLTGGLGAMPSLHVGYAVLLCALMLRCKSHFAAIFVVFTAWIIFDSIGLRWHYIIDLPFGIALAFFGYWLAERLAARFEKGSVRREPPEQVRAQIGLSEQPAAINSKA
jgi:hypothetical protein